MSSPRPRTEMCYNCIKIIVIGMLMVTLCYSIFIEAAAIPSKSKQFFEPRQRMALQDFRNIRVLRSSSEDSKENVPTRYCYNMPCGWAVYNINTRNVEYFMRNTCECADASYKCVRSGDDLSASAYVYRCRQNITAEDIVSPEEDSY